MIFLILMGAGVMALGLYTLMPVILFYAGQRRDLYFHPETTWRSMAKWGGVQLIGGLSLLAIGVATQGFFFIFITAMSLFAVGWFGGDWLLQRFPPRWVREFEESRPPQELEAVRQNGIALMRSYPQAMRLILRSPDGWDTWMLTVTHLIPMASLEVYERRARQAIVHHLYPVAVVAANNIIHFRPDIAHGYVLRAEAYFKDHKYALALADLSIVLDKQPHDAEQLYQRARIHMILEQPHAAIADLNRAVEIAPQESRFLTLRETAYKVAEEKMQSLTKYPYNEIKRGSHD